MRWQQAADGVLLARHDALDLTLTLVLGDRRALLIDTGFGDPDFAAAVRERTELAVDVVYTHAHFDHVYGTEHFPEATVYAHPDCARSLAEYGPSDVDEWADFTTAQGFPREANFLRQARLVQPTVLVEHELRLDLGERIVHLRHPGRGHTGGDLVVQVPDVAVVVAGDLVEEGAEPQAGDDAFLTEWPSTLDAILDLAPTLVIPGHGASVDASFVAAQRESLRQRAAITPDR